MNSMENPVQIHGNPSEIHEIRRKSMRNLFVPLICTAFGRRQNSIRKKKAQREVLPGGDKKDQGDKGDKEDKGDKGG